MLGKKSYIDAVCLIVWLFNVHYNKNVSLHCFCLCISHEKQTWKRTQYAGVSTDK